MKLLSFFDGEYLFQRVTYFLVWFQHLNGKYLPVVYFLAHLMRNILRGDSGYTWPCYVMDMDMLYTT
jgi:hypothetical protein